MTGQNGNGAVHHGGGNQESTDGVPRAEGDQGWGSRAQRVEVVIATATLAITVAGSTDSELHGRRLWALAALLMVVIGVAALAVTACFSLLLWAAKTTVRHLTSPDSRIRTSLRGVSPRTRTWARWILSGVVCVIIGYALGTWVTDGIQDYRRGCVTPVEVPVAASPETFETASALARAFERSTARTNDGCPQADLSVYAVDPGEAQQGLVQEWTNPADDRESMNYLRDLGPRPQIWIPDSTVDVDRLARAIDRNGSGPGLGQPVIYGGTPLVLALPSEQKRPADPVPADWSALIAAYRQAELSIVSPDMTTSAAGQLLLASTYPTEQHWQDEQFAAARAVEDDLAIGRKQTRYPLGDTATLLRHYQDSGCPDDRIAFVVPQQFATRPAFAGQQVRADLGCSGAESTPLTTIQPQTAAVMNHPLVQLKWDGDDTEKVDSAAGRAAEFGRWVTTTGGRATIEKTGLIPGDRRPDRPGATRGLDPGLVDLIDAALKKRAETVLRPAEIMFAIDTSGSMATRLELGAAVLSSTANRLSDDDRLGLLSFGGDRPVVRQPVRVVAAAADGSSSGRTAPGESTRDAVRRELSRLQPAGATPLRRALRQGIQALRDQPPEPTAKTPALRALVVMTDGKDTAGGATSFVLADEAEQAGIRVYVVAAGSIDCRQDLLRTVTQSSGGLCINAERGPEPIADKLAAAIWGIS